MGDRSGQHGIRINDQYRVCVRWEDGHTGDVEVTDYHSKGTDRGGLVRRRLPTHRPPPHPGEMLLE